MNILIDIYRDGRLIDTVAVEPSDYFDRELIRLWLIDDEQYPADIWLEQRRAPSHPNHA